MADRPLLERPLTRVVGDRTAAKLRDGLSLETVGDLVHHFPRRYVTFNNVSPLRDLIPGEHATVVARVVRVHTVTARNGKMMVKVLIAGDDDRTLELTFFAPSHKALRYFTGSLRVGRRVLFDGKVGEFRGVAQLVNPTFELLAVDDDDDMVEAVASLVIPIYPASSKASSWLVARAVEAVLPQVEPEDVPEVLPEAVRMEWGLPAPLEALHLVHRPTHPDHIEQGRARFRFEEAFVLQAALARRRLQARAMPATPRPASGAGLLAAFDARLPFQLTAGQREIGEQIAADLAASHPMHRLLQGEVGSGKTVVALRAMLAVVDSGGQAALLAPTEVLAQQHHRSITALLGDLAGAGTLSLDGPQPAAEAIVVSLLTGSLSAPARRQVLTDAASGRAAIVVGTHALIQQGVQFADLGLVVVDEQHRFGVEQRDALRAKGVHTPHLLVMTATPIPRTVAMTVFGDLEMSTLREVPAGRTPVESHVVPMAKPAWLSRCWQAVRAQIDAGRQAFVVCPAIETRDGGEPAADRSPAPEEDGIDWALPGFERPRDFSRPSPVSIDEALALLSSEPVLAGVRIGVLHGRLPTEEKDAVMSAFAAGDLDLLVATTVIEVGIDVPNATVMVVMDATRFGISQLHQLRGRVGRGTHPGLCFFVASQATNTGEGSLLEQVAATTDGFELSRLDLLTRREGDVLGVAQSGSLSSLRVLRVTRDEEIIAQARRLASPLVEADPDLQHSPALRAAITRMLGPDREVFLDRG